MLNFKTIPKFCISLKNSPRREVVKQEFDKNNFSVNFFDAIDKHDLIVPELSEKLKTEPDNNLDGILACMQSHLEVIKHAKRAGLKEICIFEDDIIFCDDFSERIKYIEKNLQEYDFISLGGHFGKPFQHFSPLVNDAIPTNIPFIYKTLHQGGTYGYIITEKVYDFILRNCTYNYGMDQFYSDHFYHRFNCFAFVPFLVGCAKGVVSEITGGDAGYPNVDWYYQQESVMFPKIDLTDCTFITAVKIDSPDRAFNFLYVIQYLCDNFKTNIIIKESDKESKVRDLLKRINKKQCNIEFIFEFSESNVFHRTRLLNDMLRTVKTPVVVNYDLDVFMEPQAYVAARDRILAGWDLIYPYAIGDDTQKMIFVPDNVKANYQGEDLLSFEIKPQQTYCGFVQFFNTKSYISGYGENEEFVSYGPEDRERCERFERLGYKVNWGNACVYHIEHSRGVDSSTSNPHFGLNDALMTKIRNLSNEELKKYYENKLTNLR